MRRRERPQPVVANRLEHFELTDWYDPEADPAPPEWWFKAGDSRRELAFEWHAIRAFRRFQDARQAAGLTPP